MSKRSDETESDPALNELLGAALRAGGELPPVTEAEVERAEAEIDEDAVDLPESLLEFRAPASRDSDGVESPAAGEPAPESRNVVELPRPRRFPFVSHLLAAAVGAAATSVLFFWQQSKVNQSAPATSSEPPVKTRDAGPEAKRVSLSYAPRCEAGCCAGKECAAAKGELTTCGSGRGCVTCDVKQLWDSRYRIRLGALAPTAEGAALLKAAGKNGLEMCVHVGSSQTACAPAHTASGADQNWALLPLVTSGQDLLAGFVFELRAPGVKAPVGSWQSPVQINATLLCRGLSLRPKNQKDEVLGVVSAFLDETHYVELARSDAVPELMTTRKHFELSGLSARIFETDKPGSEHFALVLGPFDKPNAERLRWSVLEQGETAKLGLGLDYAGSARDVP